MIHEKNSEFMEVVNGQISSRTKPLSSFDDVEEVFSEPPVLEVRDQLLGLLIASSAGNLGAWRRIKVTAWMQKMVWCDGF
jgi:hypothetical protein